MKMLALGPMGAQGPEQGMIAARPVCPVDRYAPESLMTIEFSVTNNVFARDILTVAQLNQAVGQLLERSIPAIWVRGEISNFTQAASGHWYFTIKDSRAAVRAVMFRSRASAVGFVPRAGDQVEIRARVSLYEPRGDYQLQVDAMRRAGLGNLYEAFLRLKEQLAFEGLFDPARKRELAPLPRAIGVITSLHAAALRDVLSALARRAPQVPVIIYPAPVQGADAAGRLAAQVRLANQRAEVDTLLLVRGGGSMKISGASMTRRWRARSRPAPFRWSAAWAMKPTSPSWTSWPTCARPPRPRRRNWPALRAASCWAASWTRRARWRAASSGGWSGPPSASTAPPASWCRRRSAWNISASA